MRWGFIAAVVLPAFSFADYPDFGRYSLDDYDKDTGLYFSMVSATSEEKGMMSSSQSVLRKNIFIYNPETKTSRNLFDKYYGNINAVLIESNYSAKAEAFEFMMFNASVKNNYGLSSRKIHDSFIVETYNEKEKAYTVWRAPKVVSTPSVLFSYKKPANWHFDVRRQVIRLLTPVDETYTVNEYTW